MLMTSFIVCRTFENGLGLDQTQQYDLGPNYLRQALMVFLDDFFFLKKLNYDLKEICREQMYSGSVTTAQAMSGKVMSL